MGYYNRKRREKKSQRENYYEILSKMCYPMVKKPKKNPSFIEMKLEKRNFTIFQKHQRKNVL